MAPAISVVIPSYNTPKVHLERLYASLLAQSLADFEAIIVDDASVEDHYGLIQDARFRVVRQQKNEGPAACRNRGVAEARSGVIFFTDTDCAVHPGALARAAAQLDKDAIVMGDTVTEVQTVFGKAVALLGFPGGGILGFDRVWRVDEDGYTNSISSCNVAFRKETFEALGCFDATFPVPGGEDTVLARRVIEAGYRIRYAPDQIVYHVERTGLRAFVRWQITRGRGNYHIKKHLGKVGGYLRLRIWTFKNSFAKAGMLYAPLVFVLLVLSVYYQVRGFYLEKRRCEHANET